MSATTRHSFSLSSPSGLCDDEVCVYVYRKISYTHLIENKINIIMYLFILFIIQFMYLFIKNAKHW